jgi:EAL domain-containing protein (putative c-di-GMP-specific phosphodiesterase class I)/LysM repeat protein
MKQSLLVRLTFLSGLLLVSAAACAEQPAERTTILTIPPDVAAIAPIETTRVETYTVQPGDFLSDIADRHEITLDELATHNQILDIALIDVGQVLEIPGTEIVSIDDFSVAAPVERFEDLYPLPRMAPPPPPTTSEQLRERIAALPWPERDVNVTIATIGTFVLAALLSWYVATRALHLSGRWAIRTLPGWGRAIWHAWGFAARQPRRVVNVLIPHSVRTWRISVQIARIVAATTAAAWRITKPVLAAAWSLTKPLIGRLWIAVRPALGTAAHFLWHGSRKSAGTDGHVPRNREQQTSRKSRWLGGGRESEPEKPSWRSEAASDLAAAFEKKQLEVRFRPVIDLDSSTLDAVEARLYWRHPQRGLLTGKDIYPATDEHPELGRALLEMLVGSGSAFLDDALGKRYPSARLIVPLTRQQIIESEPLAVIDWAISNTDLSLDRLVVSVEESHVLEDPAAAIDFVRNVRAMGLAAQLDGYRQLESTRLEALEASSVAADFRGVTGSDAARQQLVDAIEAAQDLRLPITAKHARGEAAVALVSKLGCSFQATGEPLTERSFVASYVDRPIEGDPNPAPDAEAEHPAEQVA